jgi:hypothetical protein
MTIEYFSYSDTVLALEDEDLNNLIFKDEKDFINSGIHYSDYAQSLLQYFYAMSISVSREVIMDLYQSFNQNIDISNQFLMTAIDYETAFFRKNRHATSLSEDIQNAFNLNQKRKDNIGIPEANFLGNKFDLLDLIEKDLQTLANNAKDQSLKLTKIFNQTTKENLKDTLSFTGYDLFPELVDIMNACDKDTLIAEAINVSEQREKVFSAQIRRVQKIF